MAHTQLAATIAPKRSSDSNRVQDVDRVAHGWYRFVLSFPPHLVRKYLQEFELTPHHRVLDPFCGTGTTLVECKKLGVPSIGIDANPMAAFASRVKTEWGLDPERLLRHANRIAAIVGNAYEKQGIPQEDDLPLFRGSSHARGELQTLPAGAQELLLKDSISRLPLHRTLLLLETLQSHEDEKAASHERLALAKALVFEIGNLRFGPEVGIGRPKRDAPVLASWLKNVREMADDLQEVRNRARVPSVVYQADSRALGTVMGPSSIDAVITSPPYPNEKDYTRTTRLELVLLGFLKKKEDLRSLKQELVRSNTRSVYKNDRDDEFVAHHREIQRIAFAIEKRRMELRKTSGFERLYPRVTKLYFGGMARHLSEVRNLLRPGARLAYVVGDQASYLRVMIRTGQLLAEIAESLGFRVLGIDLFRTRLATATRERLREEVVVLQWPGDGGTSSK